MSTYECPACGGDYGRGVPEGERCHCSQERREEHERIRDAHLELDQDFRGRWHVFDATTSEPRCEDEPPRRQGDAQTDVCEGFGSEREAVTRALSLAERR